MRPGPCTPNPRCGTLRKQVYEFTGASGGIYIAEPPPGVPLSSLLAQALSHALGSPLPLPLDALLACPVGQLPGLRAALVPQAPAGDD